MTRRLLLLSYFFPPFNPTESRRSLTIVRAAVAAGWQVDVITTYASDVHSAGTYDHWRSVLACPDRVQVSRTRRDPYRHASIDFLLRNLEDARAAPLRNLHKAMTFPDPMIAWLAVAIPSALRCARQNPPDVVMTQSYPYSCHVGGLALARFTKRPWIVDTRDGWAVDDTEQFRMIEPSARARSWHRKLLRRIIAGCTQYWSLTPGISAATARFDPEQNPLKFDSVCQGFDRRPEGLDGVEPPRNDRVIIGYAGRFRPGLTPFTPVLDALVTLKKEHPAYFDRTLIRIWGGSPENQAVFMQAFERGVSSAVEVCPTLPEPELILALAGCSALLLTSGSSPWTRLRLTTKIFVYLSTSRPVIAVCDHDSSIADLVTRTGIGRVCDLKLDPSSLSSAITEFHATRADVTRLPFYYPRPEIIDEYSLDLGVMPLIARKLDEACAAVIRE